MIAKYENNLKKILSNKEDLFMYLKVLSKTYKYDFKTGIILYDTDKKNLKLATKKFWESINCKVDYTKGINVINNNNENIVLFNIDDVTNIPKFNLFEFDLNDNYISLYEYSKSLSIQIKEKYDGIEDIFSNIAENVVYSNIFIDLNEQEKLFYISIIKQTLANKLNYEADYINFKIQNIKKAEEILMTLTSAIRYEIDYIIKFIKNSKNISNKTQNQEKRTIENKISQKNIDDELLKGSGFENGKYRIYEFFKDNHTIKEKIEFLKNEYGTGGYSKSDTGDFINRQYYDSSGIKLEKRNENYTDKLLLKWKEVSKRIEHLIKENIYLDEEEIKDYNSNYLQKDSKEDENSNYWIIEFAEIKGYSNKILTKDLLDEIKSLDENILLHNKLKGEDEYGNITDEYMGYNKFYFDHIVGGKVIEHFKIDIGDGNEANQRDFQYLYEHMNISKENEEHIEAEKIGLEYNITEKTMKDKVAVKVGNYYSVVEKDRVKDISLEETGIRIYPKENNFDGKIYPLYRGRTFEESTKIDALFDEMATSMKEVNLTDFNDVFYLENQGLYEISSDKVTKEKGGFDFAVASFNTQFPDYYNDIYVYNRNLKIDDTYQNIAYINRENEIHFNVNLPEEEKAKVLELRDKKEILSTLIFKEVKDIGKYQFHPQSEELILDEKNISEDLLKSPEHITDNIDEKEGYKAELVLDMKNKQLKQNLRYNGYMLNSNLAIQYESYHEILQNLPYLLDDNHRTVMLTSYINQQTFDHLIDGDGNSLKLTKHKPETVDKKLESYVSWKENREERYTPDNEYMGGIPPINYKITGEDEILPPSERLKNNIEAIKVLKEIEERHSHATREEQDILSKYVGWGGLSDVFDEEKKGQWSKARDFLKENLSQSEYDAARESTLTAFYTPKVVIESIYQALSNMGFESGNILEPSMGTGRFLGNLPDSMQSSKFYGVELDSISGRIASKLYPNANIQIKGFEETTFSNNLFDISIGNVPFGEFKVNDREYDKNNFLIHDYFFAKSIDKVRPGGVIAFITSSGTMDKKDDSIRRYIGSRCDLLGAIRLPNTTFKGVAGTEVTSDILFLKKKSGILDKEQDWYKLDYDENGYRYNKYFVDYPEMVLGNITEISGRFGNILTCKKKENTNLKELLEDAILNLNGNYEEVEIETIEDLGNDVKVISANDEVKNFSFTIVDDEVYYREDSVMTSYPFNEKDIKKIKDYIELTSALKELIRLQKEDYSDDEIKQAQVKLNEVYDKFSKKHKFINSAQNTKLLSRDSNFPLVSSIEKLEENKFKEKGDIFFKRTIAKSKLVDKVNNLEQALILSVASKARVDFEYMSDLLSGMDKETIINGLKGQIFLDIKAFDKENNLFPFRENQNEENFAFNYVTADEYLSGNIREKIGILNDYIEYYNNALSFMPDNEVNKISEIKSELSGIEFQKKKLEEVMPKDLTASEINVRLGATWIPEEDIKSFMVNLLKTPYYATTKINVRYSSFTSGWNVEGKSVDKNNDLANLTYGTSRVSAYELIEDCLNLRDTKVWDQVINEDGSKKSVLNKKETMLANQKQELIKEEFKNFIFEEPERRHRLEKIYNEKFNSVVNREFDGSHLLLEGMSSEISLRPHQKDAIARSLYGGNTLLAHVVGAGKTFEMVASAMESKRLGMCSKSLFVVPKHLTEQIGREFMQLYPGANIMVATKKDFEPQNRKRFIGKIATGEYDAVIIGHTQFEKIPMSKEYQENHLKTEIEKILDYISQCKYSRNKNFTVKELQKTKKKLEERLEKLNDDFKKDDVITFEELGVDKLFIDEAHNYKNLYIYTKMRNVAGIGRSAALKSSDMFMKCRYMDEMTNGKGIVFATGTPISNSMTELYTMQRYLQYEELKNKGLQNFDSWASTFGETVSSIELSPEGDKYRVKTRFSKFYNLPELMSMFKDVSDIKTADMLNLPTPIAHYETIVTKPTEEQKEILKSLSERADDVRDKKVEPEEDNMLKITNDGKKLALDQRLINPLLPDDENSKVNICVKNIFSIWDKTKEKKSTQLVFSDMSTPKDEEEFNIYDDIKSKLVNLGIPEKEIAFIHDANTEKQKDQLFAKVRKGEVRVLLGSTQKMGAGTNVQDKLIALHDVDVPWRPSDLEQRAGRIVRQGNENKEVYIFRYVTENTFDSYLWQTIENKQRFISQIMTSKTPVRVADDVDENTLSYAEIKALATGNPLIKEKMDLDFEVTKLKMLEANHKSNIYKLEDKIIKFYPKEIERLEDRIEKLKVDIQLVEPLGIGDNKFTKMEIKGISYTDKKEAGEKLLEALKTSIIKDKQVVGKYRNFDIELSYDSFYNRFNFSLKGALKHSGEIGKSADGNITRMDNVLDKLEDKLKDSIEKLEAIKNQLENAKIEVKKPFEKADILKEKINRLKIVEKELDVSIENTSQYSIENQLNMTYNTIIEDDYELEL